MQARRKRQVGQPVNFEALQKLLSSSQEYNAIDEEPLDEIRVHDSYRQEENRRLSMNSQQITFYTNLYDDAHRGRSFRDLNIGTAEFQETFINSETTWWLDLQYPAESDLRLLCTALNVHPLTLEDILNRETREKIEDYATYYFACVWSTLSSVNEPEDTYKPFSTYLIVFPTGTVTISFIESDHPAKVQRRIETLKDHMLITSDWLFYAFIDDIVDSFFPLISKVDLRVDEIEDQVYTTRQAEIPNFLSLIERTQKSVSSMTRLLNGKVGMLSTFKKRYSDPALFPNNKQLSQGLDLYIKDVQDHVVTMVSNLSHFDSLLKRSQGNFLAALEIESIQRKQKLNFFLGQVAVFAMIFTLLNVICQIFSTNVNAGVEMYTSDEPAAWFIIMGAEMVITIVLWYWARSKKWC